MYAVRLRGGDFLLGFSSTNYGGTALLRSDTHAQPYRDLEAAERAAASCRGHRYRECEVIPFPEGLRSADWDGGRDGGHPARHSAHPDWTGWWAVIAECTFVCVERCRTREEAAEAALRRTAEAEARGSGLSAGTHEARVATADARLADWLTWRK